MYAQLWHLDAQQKLERELKEKAEKHANVKNTMAVLDWQKNTRALQNQKETELTAKEREMLKSQWVAEEAAEKNMHAQKFALER